MRLVCPNCSAQYEIDASMIPDEGRDVQCSNCGHTWFELPAPGAGDTTPSLVEEIDISAESGDDSDFDADLQAAVYGSVDEADAPPLKEDSSEAAAADREELAEEAKDETAESPVDTSLSEPDTDGATDESEHSESASDAVKALTAAGAAALGRDGTDAAPTTPRRPADAAALDILREEAERELSQRRAPPSDTIETQTDLGLDTIRARQTPSRALRARMAHLGEDAPEEPSKPAQVSDRPVVNEVDDTFEDRRRDLLPGIDELNSTLKKTDDRTPEEQAEARRRSGFRIGFLLVIFLVVAMIFAYAQAPAIARALPETEGPLISYVDAANGVRDWIDGMLGN